MYILTTKSCIPCAFTHTGSWCRTTPKIAYNPRPIYIKQQAKFETNTYIRNIDFLWWKFSLWFHKKKGKFPGNRKLKSYSALNNLQHMHLLFKITPYLKSIHPLGAVIIATQLGQKEGWTRWFQNTTNSLRLMIMFYILQDNFFSIKTRPKLKVHIEIKICHSSILLLNSFFHGVLNMTI